jgi:hypothetical protein
VKRSFVVSSELTEVSHSSIVYDKGGSFLVFAKGSV